MKILTRVNRIKDPTPKEIEEAMNEDPNSDFVRCTYPIHEGDKLLRITEELSYITVLGDKESLFSDNGFGGEGEGEGGGGERPLV